MINKEKSRQRRARATRARIKLQKVNRLSIHRTNLSVKFATSWLLLRATAAT